MYGPCRSPIVADHPLRPATRHRLGGPLPHQLADRPQASFLASTTCVGTLILRSHGELSNLSAGCAPPERSTYVLLTRLPLPAHSAGTLTVQTGHRQTLTETVRNCPCVFYSPQLSVCQCYALTDRLACIRHAASVHPEPGSNSY